jgi:hypothetical protein
MEGLKMKQINRSAQDFIRQFGITPFREFLPDEIIKNIAKSIKKIRDRKFSMASWLWLLVLVQIDSTIESIDELIKLKWLTLRKELGLAESPPPVTKQAFSKRNIQTPVKILEEIFKYLINYSRDSIKIDLYKGSYLVEIFDTTTIDLVARLISKFPGGTNKSRKIMKAQARLHISFDFLRGIPDVVLITAGRTNEKRKAKRLMRSHKGSVIFIIDLGYWCYEFLHEITQQGSYFVSRLRADCHPKKIKKLGKGDWLVELPQKGRSRKKNIYRLVSIKMPGLGRYYYLTNLLDNQKFPPEEIALIYKGRWEIEIFFRDLKHILRLTRFISYKPNGIKIQIYIALITYILTKILINKAAQRHQVTATDFSFPRALKVIRVWVQHKIVRLYQGFSPDVHRDEELLLLIMRYAYNEPPTTEKDENEQIQTKQEAKNGAA